MANAVRQELFKAKFFMEKDNRVYKTMNTKTIRIHNIL